MHQIFPAADVVAVILRGKFGDPESLIVVSEVRLRPRAAERRARCDEHGKPALVFGQLLGARFLYAFADVRQGLKVCHRRRGVVAVVEERAARLTKTQATHAGAVVDAQQKIQLIERAHLSDIPGRRSRLAALHQHTAPPVGC